MEQQSTRAIVESATRAPSIHNTQPWRFVSHPQAIEVWTDPSRGLAVLDPTGRGRHISCGAALLHARLAAAAAGYAASVTILPDPAEPDHLADLALVAAAPDAAAGAETAELVAAISARHTSREPFSNEPIAADTVDALRQAAADEGAWLRVIETPEDATAIAVLMAHADEVQAADPAYVEELRQWTQRGDTGDGIPAAAIPHAAPSERGSNYRLRDFVTDREQVPDAPHEPPPVERPLIAVLGTTDDDVRAWIAAGQALGRLLLTATEHQVIASPLTQALEIPATRARLAAELGVVGHPQMLLRLGYGATGATKATGATRETGATGSAATGTATPRRPLDEILEQRES
jgi:mannitol/fructose-specific phosphotransferase system IIA component (Ntr-type)